MLNKKNTFTTLIVLMLLFSTFIFAQDVTEFKGKVTSSNSNKGLPLANLSVIDTNISTVTNTEGEFLLKVPNTYLSKSVVITYLGYEKQEIALSKLNSNNNNNKIKLKEAATILARVDVNSPKDAETLVRKALQLKGENYISNETVMTGFYRESIKKRNKNASLSEAVLKIQKQPYTSNKKDIINLVKARKKTNYSRLDTIALKLQGGPFSALFVDFIKYPKFIFTNQTIKYYNFEFDRSTQVNNNLVYVVNFIQKEGIERPLYFGKLFIDANCYAITNAIYNLNVENRSEASKFFVRKKPRKLKVYPTEASYLINYRVKNGKWYYGYSKMILTFKVNWRNRLFNSKYTLQSEMAITDWSENATTFSNKSVNRLKQNTIMEERASGFSDPDFWGEYNIIEPEKSIESAIKKISRQLKKT